MEINKEYMFSTEFSKVTGYPLTTLRSLIKRGLLPHQKLGRKYLIHVKGALRVLQRNLEGLPVKQAIERIESEENYNNRKKAFSDKNFDFIDALNKLKY